MKRINQGFHKIGVKLIVAVGLATIIIIGCYSYINLRSQSNMLLSEFERHANQLSETIKKATRIGMLKNEREQTFGIINMIGTEKGIKKIRIFNKEGEIIYSNDSTQVGKMVNKKAESCYACHTADQPLEKLPIDNRTRIFRVNPDSTEILGVMNPIYNEPSCWNSDCHVHPKSQKVLGVLDITMCLKDVEQAQRTSTIKLIIFAITSILALSLIIAFFVHKWLVQPVNTLMEATHEIGVGNLNYRVKDLGNNELGILGRAFNKMTKRLAEARIQLFQSDKMASLGRLAAGVAHEINNPLTGVLTYASFLQKRLKKDPEIQEDLSVIVKETIRSREIVKGLLDFARQSVPKKNEVSIDELIDNSIKVTKNQLKLKHLEIVKETQPDLPLITVDANQIQQVFINLIVNAIDAVPSDKGQIRISTSLVKLSPLGVSQIKNAVCRKRHSLIDNEIKIGGLPSIKVQATQNGKTGFINLDPIYGKHNHQYGFTVVEGKSIEMYCPRCEVSLNDSKKVCPKCGSNIYTFEVPPNGMFEGCTNKACNWERWQAMDEVGEKDYVEIKIADNGSGIPEEDLPRIFEPFFSTKGQKGTGLGLAIIWGIIDNHNGTINVESKVNKGTTFTIRLPK
ncbi:sensor protein ZraS [bacterium BMS3Abin04]|nr:sensor protein ZraS [bacterium BMS3Abin04]